MRYIEELQKFVEDSQWKRSLSLEPVEPDPHHHSNAVVMNLNLSPSKNSAKAHEVPTQQQQQHVFVPGHRRAKSDGYGMFFMSKKQEGNAAENKAANYSHHLLDDSKLEEEPVHPNAGDKQSTVCTTKPVASSLHHSLKKYSFMIEKTEGGVMKILRNPGIKCQHQVNILAKRPLWPHVPMLEL